MRKYLIAIFVVVIGWVVFDFLYYYAGVLYIPGFRGRTYFSLADEEQLYLDQGKGFEPFELRGVNMGFGKPGHFSTEKAITKDEYLRWFQQIQDLEANVIRIYTVGPVDFYEAFYEYNIENPEPLYLIHGVGLDDYLTNSIYSAVDDVFYKSFLDNCREVVDIVHGRHKDNPDGLIFSQHYRWDISPWVYGYILGVDWNASLVGYSDESFPQQEQLNGTYFYTEDASNFELFLANTAEKVVSYETEKYGTQRVMAFSNWATTDPLDYPEKVEEYWSKFASIDVEHIHCTEDFPPGQFASYHIYPYSLDYYKYFDSHETNTYLQYLSDLNEHHDIPVVISEFGVPSSRGIAAEDTSQGRNQGAMSEKSQGEALVSMYQDIMCAGSAGGIVFTWQDEWFKHTWNTMASVETTTAPYWSDYQTCVQYYGLLSFDPGKEQSVCYVDGNQEDWTELQPISQQSGVRLSMQYDEKFVYFLIEKEAANMNTDTLYVPIDVTPKSGATYASNLSVSMTEAADFVIELNGTNESRLWVQDRYNILRALFYDEISTEDFMSVKFPAVDTDSFSKVEMRLINEQFYERSSPTDTNYADDIQISFQQYSNNTLVQYVVSTRYETGKLTYGNANPNSPDFNSLADFCAGDGFVEIKLPWQLLNFADPSNMKIHDDYYEVYGVEYLTIDHINVGAGDGSETIEMVPFPLKKLGKNPEYHERLKESYYILQDFWKHN